MNVVAFVGNVTADADVRSLPSGVSVTKFSLAINEPYKDKATQEWVDNTSYFDLEAFGTLADKAAKLVKGDMVSVVCQARQDRWERDGEKRSKVMFRVNVLKVLKYKNPKSTDGNADPVAAPVTSDSSGFGDDIPF